MKKGDNFILFQEEPIKICDDKDLNKGLIYESVYSDSLHFDRLPELHVVHYIDNTTAINLYTKKYYIYTIKISRDGIIELYDIKFRVKPSPQEINNGDEICVTVYGVNKTIYKKILLK